MYDKLLRVATSELSVGVEMHFNNHKVKATKSVEIKSLLNQVDAAFEQIKIHKALTDGYLSDSIIESL